MKYVYTKKIKGRSKNKHHKSKKINKYKHKSKNKQNKNRSKKILKGGGKSSASASTLSSASASKKIKPVTVSSALPQRKSSRLVKTDHISSSFKTPQKTIVDKMKENKEKKIIEQQMKMEIETLINSFFENLKNSHFPEAICALYKLYTLFPYDELKSKLYSSDFKKKYQDTFYFKKIIINSFGVTICDFQARNNYIYFLSYIFKKLAEGASINCDGKELPFLYSIDKTKPSILNILKQFLGYLDTACVTTISYSIPSEKYNLYKNIVDGLQPASRYSELTYAEIALGEIIYSLNQLIHTRKFPSLQYILDNMVTHNLDGSIATYSMNTTVLSRIIKQSYTDFLEKISEEVEEVEEVD